MLKDIGIGFYNMALKGIRDEGHPVEKRARKRLKICSTCTSRKGMRCGICGCYLPGMSRSTKHCDLNKF